jgi:hypothetical protein
VSSSGLSVCFHSNKSLVSSLAPAPRLFYAEAQADSSRIPGDPEFVEGGAWRDF